MPIFRCLLHKKLSLKCLCDKLREKKFFISSTSLVLNSSVKEVSWQNQSTEILLRVSSVLNTKIFIIFINKV